LYLYFSLIYYNNVKLYDIYYYVVLYLYLMLSVVDFVKFCGPQV